jgi:4-hydroxy-2,2'-bipyrrole-5-methanol dehydrogenase
MTAPPRAATQAPAFIAALGTAAEVAARSPSSHNCQPWALAALVSQEARAAVGGLPDQPGARPYLVLALDEDRSLRALPAHAVEMVLSCGMYWELLTAALTALGWQVSATRYAGALARDAVRSSAPPGGISLPAGWPRAWEPLAVAAAEPCPADPAAFASLRALAGQRRTNRGGYRTDGSALDRLSADQTVAVTGTGAMAVRVDHIRDARERTEVARLVARYGGRDFAHAAAWRETHSFIRRDRADAQRRGDGFTLEQLLGPMPRPKELLVRAALAPGTMRVLRVAGYPRLLATQLAQVVTRSPGLVVIATERPEPGTEELFRAGSAIARYWVAATRHGLALHPVSIVLQHDDVRRRLQRALGVTGRAVFLARIGTPVAQVPPTPRRAPQASWRTF